ncbi:MAG: hypothetical protein M0Z41_05970 [Peptococcaceae bacterium]|nr:hypothetical protein [Peptococcaceae bacterium]
MVSYCEKQDISGDEEKSSRFQTRQRAVAWCDYGGAGRAKGVSEPREESAALGPGE